jgi:hypothetical protein
MAVSYWVRPERVAHPFFSTPGADSAGQILLQSPGIAALKSHRHIAAIVLIAIHDLEQQPSHRDYLIEETGHELARQHQ